MLTAKPAVTHHPWQLCHPELPLFFISYLTVWGVEPVVTHQTSWLESTGAQVVCNKTKLVGVLFEKGPNVPLSVVWARY